MKVIPRKKYTALKEREIRVINISNEAIYELLREYIMENANAFFDVKDADECGSDYFFQTWWDHDSGIFSCAVLSEKYIGTNLNFSEIIQRIGITTDSVYTSNRYKVLSLDSSIINNDGQ